MLTIIYEKRSIRRCLTRRMPKIIDVTEVPIEGKHAFVSAANLLERSFADQACTIVNGTRSFLFLRSLLLQFSLRFFALLFAEKLILIYVEWAHIWSKSIDLSKVLKIRHRSLEAALTLAAGACDALVRVRIVGRVLHTLANGAPRGRWLNSFHFTTFVCRPVIRLFLFGGLISFCSNYLILRFNRFWFVTLTRNDFDFLSFKLLVVGTRLHNYKICGG